LKSSRPAWLRHQRSPVFFAGTTADSLRLTTERLSF
jgi:hypothetical protein